jgi:hypothetical protein
MDDIDAEHKLMSSKLLMYTLVSKIPYELRPECRKCYANFATTAELKEHLTNNPKHAIPFQNMEQAVPKKLGLEQPEAVPLVVSASISTVGLKSTSRRASTAARQSFHATLATTNGRRRRMRLVRLRSMLVAVVTNSNRKRQCCCSAIAMTSYASSEAL